MDLKNKIKLVAVDLDGSLLTDEKCLCTGAREILNNAIKNGITILPITGRPYSGIPKCVLDIDGIDYIVASNGTQIINAKSNEPIYSHTIPNKRTNQLIDYLQDKAVMFEVFCDNVGYVEDELYKYYVEKFTNTPIGDYIFTSRKKTPSLKALFDGTNRCADEIFITCQSEKIRQELIDFLDKQRDLQYCTLGNVFLEITSLGADKGNALKYMCSYLDIDINSTIAFGDGENDFELLQTAGVSVAMGNAYDSLKKNADLVTDTNNNNGVCKIIKQLY